MHQVVRHCERMGAAQRAGFRLVREEPEEIFHEGELAQEWELDL